VRKFVEDISAHYGDRVLPQQSVYEFNDIYVGRTVRACVHIDGQNTGGRAMYRRHRKCLHLLDFQPTKVKSLHAARLWSMWQGSGYIEATSGKTMEC
jgi:hypothetical protein